MNYIPDVDILTDILRSAGLKTDLLARHALHEPWAMRFPCAKSMGFHLVTHGEAWVRAPRFETPLRLGRGDMILLNRGFDHEVATAPDVPVPQDVGVGPFPGRLSAEAESASGTARAVLVCGLYRFQTEPIHPFFSELPDVLVVRADEIAPHVPLFAAQQLLAAELAHPGQGSETVVKALVDVMFHYLVRGWLDKACPVNSRWALTLKDPHLVRAFAAMHADPARDWSLEELAAEAGQSRAAFAQRFKRLTGDTPGRYLARIRIQRAMDLLRSTEETLERIAAQVGYGDPFVFSKAFKRVQGQSPREYRKSALAA